MPRTKHKTKPPVLKEALPTPDFCPGCSRSKHVADFGTTTGAFCYTKLFCKNCQANLTREQIISRGRSYLAKYRGKLKYQSVKKARKYLPQTLK